MSAAELRKAAKQLAAERVAFTPDMAQALAVWLEAVAERQEPQSRWGSRSHSWTGSREANAIARLVNGDAS